MSHYLNGPNRNQLTGFDKSSGLIGLNFFIDNLEKHFFSNVSLQTTFTSEDWSQLSIQMDCNLTLSEILDHFGNGIWGNFVYQNSVLGQSLDHLQELNESTIEIDEFSIILTDISIIIKSIKGLSIAAQLKDILTSLGNHKNHFSKGSTEKPYEIYIPVFEEDMSTDQLHTLKENNRLNKDYLKYWGIYFDSEDEALIYDLDNSQFIPADLNLYMTDQ